MTAPTISIVVPSYTAAPEVARRLERLARSPHVVEVLLVLPEPRSAPAGVAEALPLDGLRGVTVLRAPLGRASQMNRGASVARGDTLLFLHADTDLPRSGLEELARARARRPAGTFAFSLGFSSDRWRYRLLAWLATLRDRVRPRPLGDQGLALERASFRARGGFEDLPVCEDVAFLRASRDVRVLRTRVATSPDRFERQGLLATLATNAALLAALRLGTPMERLARVYYGAAYADAWRAARPRPRLGARVDGRPVPSPDA